MPPTESIANSGALSAATPLGEYVWSIGDAELGLAYILVSIFCGVSGAVLCALFGRSPRLREQQGARLAGALGVVSGVGLYLAVVPEDQLETLTVAWVSVLAVSGYALIGGYLAVRACVVAVQTLATRLPRDRVGAGSRLLRPSLAGYQRLLKERELELELNPTDARLRKELFEIHLELGDADSAVYHAYALIEFLPHGPAHGLALYRLCQTLVDRMNRLEEAQPYLRRIIRLYPRSFFASYARRLVNLYEAYADREL